MKPNTPASSRNTSTDHHEDRSPQRGRNCRQARLAFRRAVRRFLRDSHLLRFHSSAAVTSRWHSAGTVATRVSPDTAATITIRSKTTAWFLPLPCAAAFLARWATGIPRAARPAFPARKPRSKACRARRSKATSEFSSFAKISKHACSPTISRAARWLQLDRRPPHYYDRADTDDPLSRIQYVDIKTYLTDDILAKVDRASMAVSLEVRAPCSITTDRNSREHSLRAKAARPRRQIYLQKSSRARPTQRRHHAHQARLRRSLGRWFRSELRDTAYDTIFGSSNGDGILDTDSLRKIWDEHQRGTYDRSPQLWAVLMFRKWRQAFGA